MLVYALHLATILSSTFFLCVFESFLIIQFACTSVYIDIEVITVSSSTYINWL